MGIFSEFAPKYWAAGLPVIPLRERNKMPLVSQWQRFSVEMPSELEQAHWVASYPDGNVGLPLGPKSGICIIDIDDESVVDLVLECLPKSPWVRVGKKGMALAYRFEGQKNFKLRGAGGGMALEFLGLGNQVVLPPSIHPDTQRPYTANCDLWEVMDKLPYLGEDIEDKLRALLPQKGFELAPGGRSSPIDVVPAGERDVQMTRQAGYLARVVLGIDRSFNCSLSEAITQMYTWVESKTANVSGDTIDPNKGTAKLLEFLIKDLEKGRTMPAGWDANMPDEWLQHPTIIKIMEMNADSRWSVVRARSWLIGKIAEKPGDDDWAVERVKELVGLVAKDEHFTKFEMSLLVATILKVVGKESGFKKSDLMQFWKDAKKENDGDGDMESHAMWARKILEEMGKEGEVRFAGGKFWQWNGSCFKAITKDEMIKTITEMTKDSAFVRTSAAYKGVREVMEAMCAGPLQEGEERGINFANGFVGEDLVLVDHDPKYGATFTLPFEYKLEDRCPKWFEFLHSCWGGESDLDERIMCLQEMFAVTLFRIAPRYQKAFLLYGKAGTGKTQVLNVLRALLPADAVTELGPEKWGERFSLTSMIGKAANICGELPEQGWVNGAAFKQIVEGSAIMTEFKGQDPFSMVADCAHWFASNYIPRSKDSTRGFARRWQILDFNRVVPENERIDGLAEIIVAEERAAIAAWALQGLRRVLDQRGFTSTKGHERRYEELRASSNTVFQFLVKNDQVARAEGAEMRAKDVYDYYVRKCQDDLRATPASYSRFTQMIEDLDLVLEERTTAIGGKEDWIIGLRKLKGLNDAA